jgi:hypothetical protein
MRRRTHGLSQAVHGSDRPLSKSMGMGRSILGLLVSVVAILELTAVTMGVARAGVDDEVSLVDAKNRTLTIQQWDTAINDIAPLDRNVLTREWFQTGRTKYAVSGLGADVFTGTLLLGYTVSFPYSVAVTMNFNYTTYNFCACTADSIGSALPPEAIASSIPPWPFPTASISVDLGNGPGVKEVSVFSVGVSGLAGDIAVAGGHGTITGVTGDVMLQPFARLVSSAGDSVTTYGAVWNLH